MVLRFGCLLGYTGLNTFMLSSNLPLTLIDLSIIDEKLFQDLSTRRIVEVVDPISPFLSPHLWALFLSIMEVFEKFITFPILKATQSMIT